MAAAVQAGSGQPAEYNHQVPVRPRPFISKSDAPISPRTPLLGRSISGAFGSPGSYSRELDEVVVYEVCQRYISAGFAGEPRPRVIWRFGYGMNESNRVGDYTNHTAKHLPETLDAESLSQYELYHADSRHVDFSLLHAKLERVVRFIHTDHLQLDSKPRKAALVIPTLLPTRVLDTVLNVLFNHYTLPTSITLLTSPAMTCVSAGLRNGLVIDIGWEETVVTAVSDYKTVDERRSIRAEKALLRSVKTSLKAEDNVISRGIPFVTLDEIRSRVIWCRSKPAIEEQYPEFQAKVVSIPDLYGREWSISMSRLSEPTENTFFARGTIPDERRCMDDEELTLPELAYEVLAHLPQDVRALCASRVVVTGAASSIPGLKHRLVTELQHRIDAYKWNPVKNRGSVSLKGHPRAVSQRSINSQTKSETDLAAVIEQDQDVGSAANSDATETPTLANTVTSKEDEVEQPPQPQQNHEDSIVERLEREAVRRGPETWNGVVRLVESLGAWAGASMVTASKVKGIHEIDREDYLKHGLKDQNMLYI